MMISSASLCTA